MATMLNPIDREIDGKIYRLTQFPCVEGREIFALYPVSAIPKIGDYKANKEIMLKLMSYVYIENSPGNWQSLSSEAYINNHVGSWETLLKIEAAMLEYNCKALQNGLISKYLKELAQMLPRQITKILTDSLQSLSAGEKPLSTN